MRFPEPSTDILESISLDEWDYRDLYGNDDEIYLATIYEYSRSESSILNMYAKWLDSPIREQCVESCAAHFSVIKNKTTPRELLKKIEVAASSMNKSAIEEIYSKELAIYITLPLELTEFRMSHNCLFMADFPVPYMRMRGMPSFSIKRRLHSAKVKSVQEGVLFGVKLANRKFLNLGNLATENVALGIDWRKPDRELLNDFRSWLKENRKEKACFSRKNYPGYALRCLAAYKLKKLYDCSGRSVINLSGDLGLFLGVEELEGSPAAKLSPIFTEQSQINRAVSDYNKFLTRLKISQENL